MTFDQFQRFVISTMEDVMARTWLIDQETRTLAEASRDSARDDPEALAKIHTRFELLDSFRKVNDMSKKDKAAYLHDCPDCIELPTDFPTSCVGPVYDALTGTITDPKCVVHCGYTLVGFGVGLWVHSDHPHPVTAGSVADNAAAATELQKVADCCKGDKKAAKGDPESLKGFNWMLILSTILALIQQLLKDQGE